MIESPYGAEGGLLRVTLASPDDPEEWRSRARILIQQNIPPERLVWASPDHDEPNLFAAGDVQCPDPSFDETGQASSTLRVPRQLLLLADRALLHSDPRRFDLLYRLLWRLQSHPRLLDDAADSDVRRLHELARTVRRDMHKMRAFVRFRLVEQPMGQKRYVAWFEPSHHILRANATFFVNRFNTMNWSILTPRGSIHWDGEHLLEGPPARREDRPDADTAEQLWREYYTAIFNPARLKVGAMLKEMPRRYWKNLPEAELIPGLIANAQSREAAMIDIGKNAFDDDPPASLSAVAQGIAACRRCPIGCNGTRAVAGEGCADASMMILGEQPGDTEELTGRPFVGPAGQLLRQHLANAAIDINRAWVTNAVKHFKYQPRGKRRLHQNPTAKEIDMCRWWVESERRLIQPRFVLALGASAARSLFGKTVSVQKIRQVPQQLDDGTLVCVTVHPSYLLRLEGEAQKAEMARFASDLRHFASCADQVGDHFTGSER